ncbi:MAG: malto-oligosyltrehalose synthase [Gemmatimonadota bacterium]
MRVPVATYRLQITELFTLDDARAIVPYLARLGITDLYLSPIFEARTGSTHGYDITDPTRIRESLGGMSALHGLALEAGRHDMGILLDIVPNHMAASPENPWWRDVLACGRRSAHARYFDIDWGDPGEPQRVRLPILGDTLDAVLDRGEITIDSSAAELVYFDNRLPLAEGSLAAAGADSGAIDADTLRRILEHQHYELEFWRAASSSMNYRRFFDIAELAGVRVEDEAVFEATHSLVLELAGTGIITGLRIDHVDGLRDPAGYLRRLRQRVRGPAGEPVYTVVEKILERDERLPDDWECEGTTGYEFLTLAIGLLIEPQGHHRLHGFYLRITGDHRSFGELVREKKLLVMDRLFGSELNALTRGLSRITGLIEPEARRALAEVTASMRVYRTYTSALTVRPVDRALIDAATADALHRSSGLEHAIAALRAVLLLHDRYASESALDWVMRWQQFSGPVMAKGFEDTALYCHNALVAVNEVGSDPVRPSLTTHELHAALALRQAHGHLSLNATATHDTKRGEDTRARTAVLSEIPDEWRARLRRWMRQGDQWKADIAEDADAEQHGADVDSLLHQTLVGAWPLGAVDSSFQERVKAYMEKAVREAKEQTSWRRPDEDYEHALARFIDLLMAQFGREGLAEEVAGLARRIAPHGALNSIAQALLRVTAPGIPDMYQGTELWSLTLVDPDNRRPVDYRLRAALLDSIERLLDHPEPALIRQLLEEWEDGRIKLLTLAAALRFRRRHRETFEEGGVTPLQATGEHADHVLAFARGSGAGACVIVLPRWTAILAGAEAAATSESFTPVRLTGAGWGDTRLIVPASLRRPWHNALTGETLTDESGGDLELARVFAAIPFALLDTSRPIGA